MSSSYYEIVMLPGGEVVLQRSDETGEPLIRINFSEEALYYLREGSMNIAKAMIDAGIDAVETLGAEAHSEDEVPFEQRVLH